VDEHNADTQATADVAPLHEEDAYLAMPEDGYGREKLFSERMCRHFREDFDLGRRASLASTTSTAPTAPSTAAVRRPPPPSVGR
jgi:hypothetical protein